MTEADRSLQTTSRDLSLMKPLARERSRLFDQQAEALRPVPADLSRCGDR